MLLLNHLHDYLEKVGSQLLKDILDGDKNEKINNRLYSCFGSLGMRFSFNGIYYKSD